MFGYGFPLFFMVFVDFAEERGIIEMCMMQEDILKQALFIDYFDIITEGHVRFVSALLKKNERLFLFVSKCGKYGSLDRERRLALVRAAFSKDDRIVIIEKEASVLPYETGDKERQKEEIFSEEDTLLIGEKPLLDAFADCVKKEECREDCFLQAQAFSDWKNYIVPPFLEKNVLKCMLGYSDLLIEHFDSLQEMLSESRYQHSLSVRDTAVSLALRHHINPIKASVAAVLHDCAKCMPLAKMQRIAEEKGIALDKAIMERGELLHSFVGTELAKSHFGVCDEEILSAIAKHTLGAEEMSELDLLIFVSDLIEPLRKPFTGLQEIRQLAQLSLTDAAIACLLQTEQYVRSRGLPFHEASELCLKQLLKRRQNMNENQFPLALAKELYEKKASDIKLLKVSHLTTIADYLLIVTGHNSIQVNALAEHILEKAAQMGQSALRVEGLQEGRWVVADFGGLLLHIFHREDREYYRLDRLWEDGTNEEVLPFKEED